MDKSDNIYQKEYLKKYLSGDMTKKKKKKKLASSNVKRSQVIDDDIDLKSMRPLDDDEVDLYQMDDDAPQIAGIIDERPEEVKAQEYYNSKRWKVFGGDDGVSVVDNLDKPQSVSDKLSLMSKEFSKGKGDSDTLNNRADPLGSKTNNEIADGKKDDSSDSDISLDRNPIRNKSLKLNHSNSQKKSGTTDRDVVGNKKHNKLPDQTLKSNWQNKKKTKDEDDSDASPPRMHNKKAYKNMKSDSDASPPRMHNKKAYKTQKSDSDASSPRTYSKKAYKNQKSDSDASPPRRDFKKKSPTREHKKSHGHHMDDSSPRRNTTKKSKYKDDDNSLPRKITSENYKRKNSSDSDISPPRRKRAEEKDTDKYKRNSKLKKERNRYSSDSDNSPPRRERQLTKHSQSTYSRDNNLHSPPRGSSYGRDKPSSRLSRRDLLDMKKVKRHYSDSDDSPPRRRKSDSFGYKNVFTMDSSGSDLSPPRKETQMRKPMKALYKPNDSSSDDNKRSKSKKMKTTLDGKQAGLQDAKQLKKELSDLKMKEDAMFSKMDASVSGAGAAPVRRDRKTGQVRDLEKEKEVQKEKEAKESVVKEKYYKWGKGIKQMEDAEERAKDVMKEMNKPLARYADDTDLDNFLKAQERDGDPMLEYLRKKQSESTPLTGVKPLYQGAFNPNRFGIRPGHRWDGVVRSNGYEKEWFAHQNARRARSDEAYKWSTSDM